MGTANGLSLARGALRVTITMSGVWERKASRISDRIVGVPIENELHLGLNGEEDEKLTFDDSQAGSCFHRCRVPDESSDLVLCQLLVNCL